MYAYKIIYSSLKGLNYSTYIYEKCYVLNNSFANARRKLYVLTTSRVEIIQKCQLGYGISKNGDQKLVRKQTVFRANKKGTTKSQELYLIF